MRIYPKKKQQDLEMVLNRVGIRKTALFLINLLLIGLENLGSQDEDQKASFLKFETDLGTKRSIFIPAVKRWNIFSYLCKVRFGLKPALMPIVIRASRLLVAS